MEERRKERDFERSIVLRDLIATIFYSVSSLAIDNRRSNMANRNRWPGLSGLPIKVQSGKAERSGETRGGLKRV